MTNKYEIKFNSNVPTWNELSFENIIFITKNNQINGSKRFYLFSYLIRPRFRVSCSLSFPFLSTIVLYYT